VLNSVPELAEWEAFVETSGWTGGAALHVDTGMHRLGLRPADVAELVPRIKSKRGMITLLMSHFVSSEIPGDPINAKQMGVFRELRGVFPGMPASLANSSGIFLGPDAHHDLVRPGVALYGANPTPGHLNLMQPVVNLQGRVIQVRSVAADMTVGYNGAWTARRPSRIAVIGIGYADGFLRAASATDLKAGAEAVVGGHRCPLAGRVSMDLLAVDVTDLPPALPQRGDFVTLLGAEITVDDLASHADTIGYEVLTSLGRRYRRVYKGP
jgi:alanine racemase